MLEGQLQEAGAENRPDHSLQQSAACLTVNDCLAHTARNQLL